MKKVIVFCLAICLVFSLTACKKDNTNNNSQGGSNVTQNNETVKIAGSDVAFKRDGTYKKYFTIGLDDGTTQDERIIEILKKYNAYCATFFINTGLLGKDSTIQVSMQEGKSVSHLRYTEEEIKTGIYNGFDLECHTYSHSSLISFDNSINELKTQIDPDIKNITKYSGYKPIGLAYANGGITYSKQTIKNLLENTDIRFARTITESGNFKLPKNFMEWHPTCSVVNNNLLNIAQRFIDAMPTNSDMLFYVWGHGYNLDTSDYWDEFETLIKMMAEDDDIVLVTNAEFYQLFKNEIPSKVG